MINYILNAIGLGATFLYGSTGEIITEKAGHLNLGIPGVMCVGAAGGCAALHYMIINGVTNGFLLVIIGIIASFGAGALMGAIYSFLTVTLKSNQNVTGLAMTTFGVGLMKYIMSGLIEGFSVPYLRAIPYFRFPFANTTNALKYCGVMVFLAIIIALGASFVLFKTKAGLHLRAVGENPATADAAGINVTLYKYVATCIGCGIAGLGGLCYIMDYSGSQEGYLTIEALGWLAVALVIFALWRPHLSIFGSIVFGALYIAGSFITRFNIIKTMAVNPLIEMLPYVVTIIVLIVTSIRDKKENHPPSGLGVNYYREER
ncbi:MAG: ABC transporter permease [Clostridia bacterium]|nr:ABC transporter permease [Clostridia bacterium]